MFASLSVDGDYTATNADDLESVTVEFATDAGPDYRCRACDATLEEYSDGFAARNGDATCWAFESDNDTGGAADGEGPHDPAAVPVSWCNSAGISVDRDEDQVTVSISVGSPLGAFCFVIRRVPDDVRDEHAGRLVMHLPYPGDQSGHMPLTHLHDGTYLVGHPYE